MQKYHINASGNVKTCVARIRDCHFPSSDHFLNKEIAVKAAEQKLSAHNKTVPALRKLKPGPAQLQEKTTEQRLTYQETLEQEKRSLKQSIAEDKYIDEKIDPSLLRRFENYKTDTTITGHIDSVLYDVRTGQNKSKALTALSNNPNISEYDMMRIVSLNSNENKEVLHNTKNKKLLEMALANEAYVDTRHNALENDLSSIDDLYVVSLLHPKNHYKKSWKSKISKNGYSAEHLAYKGSAKNAPENLKEAYALKKTAVTMMERNEGVKSAEDIEDFTNRIINSAGYKKLAHVYADNHSSLFKQIDNSSKFIELTLRTKYYAEKLNTTRELVKTKRKNSGAYGRGHNNLPRQQYSPTTDNSAPSATPAISPAQVDITKLDKFKNVVSMASYEQSVELQKRWKDGIDELPLEMKKNVLNKRFNNTQEGLRGVVDLFKTSDTEGQMVKSGLNNFVNHINNMREQEKRKGYIAVDNPEFITPAGLIKVEEHVGNYDYGEKLTFRVNGEKFEMSKPMQSDKWTTFMHIKENSGTEVEKPETKKGFWARLFT